MLSVFGTIFRPSQSANEEIINFLGDITIPEPEDTTCETVFDVKNYLPKWLVEESESLPEGDPSMVKFLQYYYDWLYCSQKSNIYSFDLFNFTDPSYLNEATVKTALNSFAPKLTEILENNSYELPLENAIKFLTFIKTNIYQRKTTKICLNLFFCQLFDQVKGVFSETQSDNTINIVYVLFDEFSTTEFQQLLNELYEEFLHPFGFAYTSQFTTSSNLRSMFDEDEQFRKSFDKPQGVTLTAWDVPLLGNYYVYNMGDTATIGSTSGCSGSTHPRAVTGNTANMPTYNHPSWTDDIVLGASFGSINIFDFLGLEYSSRNPNSNITEC